MVFFPEIYKREVLKWKEDDITFYETHNLPAMINKVFNQHFATFVGAPGSGKTATVRHIALKLQQQGYDILPIRDIKDTETYCDPYNPQVFVFDDVLGKFGLDRGNFEVLCRFKDRFVNPIMSETKFLMTCREVLYRNEMISDSFLLKQDNVVLLNSEENMLNDQDKLELLAKYELDTNMLSQADLASTSNMFPLLCKLFSTKTEFKNYGPTFFKSPVPCIQKELDVMETRNKVQYGSLVLLMANENKLSKEILDNGNNLNNEFDFNEKKHKFLEACKVRSVTENFELLDALSEMEGTYTKCCCSEFSFVHDSMFEIVAYHFGRRFSGLMLFYMSSDYIANYIKVETCNTEKTENESIKSRNGDTDSKVIATQANAINLSIQLHESSYPLLAERMYSDVENGEFYNVFGNAALKHPSVLKSFIKLMERKSYKDLHFLFLAERKEKIKFQDDSDITDWDNTDMWLSHYLLINERVVEYQYLTSVRAISWVIFNGHHEILQNIIDQTLKFTGTVEFLFRNSYNEYKQPHRDLEQEEFSVDNVMRDKSNGKDCSRGYTKMASVDTENHTDTFCEPEIIEKHRLLCLGCYSGDLKTVQLLLKYVFADSIKYASVFHTNSKWDKEPLAIACDIGNVNIAKELIRAGADVNLKEGFNSPIICACKKGYASIVEVCIKAGASINTNYDFDEYETPLIVACRNGRLDVVKVLIKAGADIYLGDENNTPIIAACRMRHLQIIEMLIKAGSDKESKYGDEISLTTECYMGRVAVIQDLIKTGIDVNCKNGPIAPLTVSCYMGHSEVVKEILRGGADPNLREGYLTPLTMACREGHFEVVELLIQVGVDVNLDDKCDTPLTAACNEGHLDIIKLLIKGGANINKKDTNKTPLTCACFNGHLSVVRELLKAGADVNLDDGSDTPLSSACFWKQLDIVKELIKAGANVNLYGNDTSPLAAASFRGHLTIVNELVKKGADVNLKDIGQTPLTAACSGRQLDVVKFLLKMGADINRKDEHKTPLTTACLMGHVGVVEILTKAGANINLSDGNETPLIKACKQGHLDIAKELIKNEADVNLVEQNRTPLTAACSIGHLSLVKTLVKAGADVNQNDGNETPLTAAHRGKHSKLVSVLIQAGCDGNLDNLNKTSPKTTYDGKSYNIIEEIINTGPFLKSGLPAPLTAACFSGDLNVVNELINAGADVNLRYCNKSQLTNE